MPFNAQASAIPGLRLLNRLSLTFGAGDPANSTVPDTRYATPGSLYLRTDGSTSTTLYVCTGQQTDSVTGETIAVWTAK